MALKRARIVDFCRKSRGFSDFENTMDRGQLCILAWILDCSLLDDRILGPKRNLDHRYFFILGRYVNKSFIEQSSFKLRCETSYWNCTVP